jgi:hypothetical protein
MAHLTRGCSALHIDELKGNRDMGGAQDPNDRLQIINLFAGYPDLIVLNGRLDLKLLVFDQLDDVPCRLGVDSFLDRYFSLDHTPGRHLILSRIEKLSIDLSPGQVFNQRVLHRSHLHIVLGSNANFLFFLVEGDLGFRLAKIVTRQDCFFGYIDRVVDLLEIDPADDVKGRHGAVR